MGNAHALGSMRIGPCPCMHVHCAIVLGCWVLLVALCERDAMLMARATLAVCTLSRSSRYIGTNILYSCIYEADLGVNIAFTAASHPSSASRASTCSLYAEAACDCE